LLVPFCYSKHR